jgi:hypothetical protein
MELQTKIAKHIADSKSKVITDAVHAMRTAEEDQSAAEKAYGSLLADVTAAAQLIADATLADVNTDIGKRMAELAAAEQKDQQSLADLDAKEEDLVAREAAMTDREAAVTLREGEAAMAHARNVTMASKLEMLKPGVLAEAFKAS